MFRKRKIGFESFFKNKWLHCRKQLSYDDSSPFFYDAGQSLSVEDCVIVGE